MRQSTGLTTSPATNVEFSSRGFYEIDKLKRIALLVTQWNDAEMKDMIIK